MSKNLLVIHKEILSLFDSELRSDEICKEQIVQILQYVTDDVYIDELQRQLNVIAGRQFDRTFFVAKTRPVIDRYVTALLEPVAFGVRTHSRADELKEMYFDVCRYDLSKRGWSRCVFEQTRATDDSVCVNCGNDNSQEFELDEKNQKQTCVHCSTQKKIMETSQTQQDYNRINVVGKFTYNRVVHFQDCIKQFQGKQNCKIPPKVYEDLDRKMASYRLLVDSDNETIRYARITPQHIMTFLKDLKYTKHYENINYIYYALTKKRVVDISHLEDKLVSDFKELIHTYDKLHDKDKSCALNRKNFMNVQYVLFQLLRRHGYKCNIEDFSILKTTDRKLFHDNICSNLFTHLGWKFTPTF